MLSSSPEHQTSVWYDAKTGSVSFSEPVAGGDPNPPADGPEPTSGEDTLIEVARRIAEEVRQAPALFCAN